MEDHSRGIPVGYRGSTSRADTRQDWHTWLHSTRSWLCIRLQVDQNSSGERDQIPLLSQPFEEETSASLQNSPSRCPTFFPRSHFTKITTYLIILLVLLISTAASAPLQIEPLRGLIERQSIPDQFGNTGNEPAPVASVSPSLVATPTTTSTSILDNQSSTSTNVPTISTTPPPESSAGPTSLASSEIPSTSSPPTLPLSTPGSTSIPSATLTPTPINPENQLQRTSPSNQLSPAILAGIIAGSSALIALLIGATLFLNRRRKARQVAEIPIRRSKIGSRLGLRIFGTRYDDRSRSSSRSGGKFTERSASVSDSFVQDKEVAVDEAKMPVSPSVYSAGRLTRAARFSSMTFGSVSSWLDKATIGRPQLVVRHTESQLLDVPRPLFAKDERRTEDRAVRAGREGESISVPRPVRPVGAEPLGRLSGMGYGLGVR